MRLSYVLPAIFVMSYIILAPSDCTLSKTSRTLSGTRPMAKSFVVVVVVEVVVVGAVVVVTAVVLISILKYILQSLRCPYC